jgi:hypothetical protein
MFFATLATKLLKTSHISSCRGKDDGKKESKYQKNIFIKLQLGTNIMANEVKTPIQTILKKCCMTILHFRFLPCGF